MFKTYANKNIYIHGDMTDITGDRERSEGMYPNLKTLFQCVSSFLTPQTSVNLSTCA